MKDTASIPGFEGFYFATKDGRIFSEARVVQVFRSYGVCQKTIKQMELSTRKNKHGYMIVSLCKDGVSRSFRVHRLVLSAFSPTEKSSILDVNHMNGLKEDNRLENLEWCTRSYNHKHRYQVLGQKHSMSGKFGHLHHRAINVQAKDRQGNVVHTFGSFMEAQRFGFSASKICVCLQGKRKTHAGLTWHAV